MLKSATALDKSRFYIWFWQKNSGQTGQPALAPQQKKTIIMDENVVFDPIIATILPQLQPSFIKL